MKRARLETGGSGKRVIAFPGGQQLKTAVSVGVACYPQDGASAEELIFRSDQRMYLDKKDGRQPTPPPDAALRFPASPLSPSVQ